MVRFIDREYELSLLSNAWKRDGANFVVLYGRRRVGKTKLVMEFIKGKDGIFFIAEDTNKKVQIQELKNKIADFLKDAFLRKTGIVEWRDLFEYLAKVLPKNQKFYFVIDEFSYIIKNDAGVPSLLQKFWDTFLSDTQIFFLVSGSIFGLMSEEVLSSTSPLYGRRAKDLLLRPLPVQHSMNFMKMPFEEKLKVYMSTGGIPEYLLKVGDYGGADAFWSGEFIKKDGYFYREPYFLLSQEFKEIKTYFTILNAISYGNTKPTEIANFIGIGAREIYPYLENLIRLGFVERVSPIVGKRKKMGIYLIKDVFFDFWFNFVFANREKIEKDEVEIDKLDINTYLGKRFEMLIRDELFHGLVGGYDTSGRWWDGNNEIDIVALDKKKKSILFGECKWQNKVNAGKILSELKEKARFVQWHNDERKEHYAIFAKSFREKIREPGLQLFDLKDLEKAFKK